MRLCFLLFFGAAAGFAQAPTLISVPHQAAPADERPLARKVARATAAGTPFLGFVLGPSPLDLRAILGTASTAHLSDPLSIPETAQCLYLPPRQRYALVEQDAPLAVWRMQTAAPNSARESLMPITGAMSHPDLVAFSPRGEAAVVYSRATNRLQIIGGLPVKPSILSELLTTDIGKLSKLAVTDDGKTIVALSENSNLLSFFKSGRWQAVPAAYKPAAWSFVPNTHDLVVSDATQNIVVLFSSLGETALPPVIHILAQGIQPDFVAVPKSGEAVILADSNSGTLWSVEPASMTLHQLSSGTRVDSLTLLRDGHTALLSVSPNLSLFHLPSASDF